MSCPNCNAPMADDQRYCLNCGVRGGDARLPFLDILRAKSDTQLVPYGQPLRAPGTAVAAAPLAPVGMPERLRTNAGLIAGVGVLLLAMLVGVLIGSGNDDAPAAAATPPPPQVISVAGAGTAAPVAEGATGATGAEEAAGASAAAGSTKQTSSKAKKEPAAAAASKAPVRATNKAVQDLDKLTGAAREKAVDKLGKNIPTGGKPPPKDSKPAAGGGDFEEIG